MSAERQYRKHRSEGSLLRPLLCLAESKLPCRYPADDFFRFTSYSPTAADAMLMSIASLQQAMAGETDETLTLI